MFRIALCDDYLSGEELLAQGESMKKYDLIILDYAMDGIINCIVCKLNSLRIKCFYAF